MVLFAWAMVALGFPASLAASLVMASLLTLAEAVPVLQSISLPSWLGLPLVWCAFCAAGYLQWFVLVPRVWRRLHASSFAAQPTVKRANTR
jgi:hypothetical protein